VDSSTIADMIRGLDILVILILTPLAVYGAFALYGLITSRGAGTGKKKTKNAPPRKRLLLPAIGIAALAALALEATVFNYQSYLKLFAGPELYTMGLAPDDPATILTSDGTVAKLQETEQLGGLTGIMFENINRKITSVFVSLDFLSHEKTNVIIQWYDEESTRAYEKTLYKYLPHENYAAIHPNGTVSTLHVFFRKSADNTVPPPELVKIAVNQQIPFYFSGLRLIVLSLLILAVILCANKELRAKTSYYLFEYKFDAASGRQKLIYAFTVLLLIIFSWMCAYTSQPADKKTVMSEGMFQYNQLLVDAFIAGRTYLDYGKPEKLLNAERPYDFKYRVHNVMNGSDRDPDLLLDASWYKGKFYLYYGPLPAVLLYVPYKLVTGEYLSYEAGVFLFCAIAIVLLAMLWRFCVKKYMPDSRFLFYLLALPTLFFAGAFYVVLRLPSFTTLIQVAGLMFAIAGILLLLKSVENEKINHLKLFFACLCLALTVGCRPNMLFISLMVPVILWKYRSWKLLAFLFVPYIMVAIPICWYNYVRFESIFEFGGIYTLTVTNNTAPGTDPIGTIAKAFRTLAFYLFHPNQYSLIYPYVESLPKSNIMVTGYMAYNQRGSGLINFPIVLCLIYFFRNIFIKERPKAFLLLSALLLAATVMILFTSTLGFHGYYVFDYRILFILPSLFCAYYFCVASSAEKLSAKTRLKVVYTLLTVTILVGLALSVTGGREQWADYSNMMLYRYLEYSLGLFRIT